MSNESVRAKFDMRRLDREPGWGYGQLYFSDQMQLNFKIQYYLNSFVE